MIAREAFREYDIRGVFGTEITAAGFALLGRAAGTWVRRGGDHPTVVVGRDCRHSGLALEESLTAGLVAAGCDVVRIGVTPTPVNYWAIRHLDAAGGLQVTGSHNPPEYNGLKLTLLGESLHGDQIQEVRRIIEREDYARGQGTVVERDLLDAYLADLKGRLFSKRSLRIVVDAGNGTGGLTAVRLYEALGHHVTPLFCDPDGNFPNHHPDPTELANLAALRAQVAALRADVGIAFDGDADRIGVIDRDGSVVFGDRLVTLLSRSVLREHPGACIIGEVKCSKTMYDDIERHGGRSVMWRTGHSLIKTKMKEERALLAGEMSGHIFFAHRYYGFDDAVYAGGRLLEILSESSDDIGTLLSDVPVLVSTPEIRVACPEAEKFELVARAVAHFQHTPEGASRVVSIDGARVEWPDGWGLVRCSNTQPLLVLRFEAETQARLAQIGALFGRVLLELSDGRVVLGPLPAS